MLDDLRAAGLLTAAEHAAAVQRLRPSREWARPADVLLLVLGTVLLLAGVVCFFAWNWEALPKMGRLGVIEVALVACFAASLRAAALPSRVLLFAASVLVGVFLAVTGQIYQTGADPWRLFALWAALIAPWVLAASFALSTLLLVLVSNFAVCLYLKQTPGPHVFDPFVALTLLNALALGVCERLEHGGRGLRRAFLLGTVAPVTMGVVLYILAPEAGESSGSTLLTWGVATAVAAYGYRNLRPDLGALSMVALGICSVLLTAIGRFLLERNEPLAYLLFALICAGVFAFAVWILRRALPREVA